LVIRQGKLLMVKTNNVFVKKKKKKRWGWGGDRCMGAWQASVSSILDKNEITIYQRNYKY